MKQSNPERPRGKKDQESGIALLLAVVVAILLSLIGLTLTRSSMTEFQMSSEFEAHEKAQLIADAAFNLARNDLRGKDLTTVLSTPAAVPRYLDYAEPAPSSPAARNPLHPYEARNIDFRRPPYPSGTRGSFGWLTPTTGTAMGSGRYFAKLSDNEDEAPLGLSNNPRVDTDYEVLLRVVGVHPGPNSEVNSVGTSSKNSLAILEGVLRRDLSFDLASPLVLYGPDVNASFSGNSFDLIGDAQHAAVTALYNAPGQGDANDAYQSLLDAIGNKGKVVGEPGPDGLSLQDGTQDIRDSNNPDATNVFDPTFLVRFVNYLATVADTLYTENTQLSGSGIQMGTPSAPRITVAQKNLTLSGSGSGAGILIVKGVFDLGGAFDFDGLILAVGEGNIRLHGANKTLKGGVYVANVSDDDDDGQPEFGEPTITVSGNSNFLFNSGNLKMAINILPMKTISLREVTPDLDPAG